jgi:serine/threonine protein kinase
MILDVDSMAHPSHRVRHNSFDSTYHGLPPPVIEERLHNDYVVMDVIGKGDFGTVWKVSHALDGKVYAVKQFNKKFRGETDRQRKLQEVYAQSSCNHCPHVVRYYESWTDNSTLFMRMEYCEGGSVHNLLPLGVYAWTEPELWDLLYQVSLGLHALHARNIVHLDVKFENIYVKFVHGKRVYKIGDFGLVRLFGDQVDCWIGFNDDEGDKRYLCATYLSQNTHWKEADIFALAMNVYEVATGVPVPSEGVAYQNVRGGILHGMDHLSTELQLLIREMLCPDPSARPTAFDVIRRCAPQVQACHGGNSCRSWYQSKDDEINTLARKWGHL